jgi:phosphatidylinositol 4-kinase A
MRQYATSTINRYLGSWEDAATYLTNAQLENEEGVESTDAAGGLIARVVILAVSLLGFLDAAAKHARFWSPFERLHLVRTLRDALSEKYMIALETALSIIRNAKSRQVGLKPWKQYTKRYAASGRPLGAMLLRQGFMQLVVSCAALQVVPADVLKDRDILEVLFSDEKVQRHEEAVYNDIPVDSLVEIAADEIKLLEEGSDYLQLGSAWQQRLASAVKGNALKCFLCCSILDEDIADSDDLISWLEATLANPVEIADDYLAAVVFKSMAILAKTSPSVASAMGRTLPRVIVNGGLDSKTASVAAECLASVLKRLPRDATITTLYSLGNVLSTTRTTAGPDRGMAPSPRFDNSVPVNGNGNGTIYQDPKQGGSMISLGPSDADEPSLGHIITIEGIVCIAWSCKDDKITALALSMLIQKISRLSLEVDAKIITESAILAVHSDPSDFRALLKLYSKLCHDALVKDNILIVDAIMRARLHLSHNIKRGSELFEIYLMYLLEAIVSQGDAHDTGNKQIADVELAAQEIAQLLQPLSTLVLVNASPDLEAELAELEGFANLQRDAWFNAVVHGFTLTSPLGRKYRKEMQVLSQYSQPLVPEDRTEELESDIELNTTLRRGKSSEHLNDHRKHLIEALPSCESEIRNLNYSETVFLEAAYLVENLRASGGDCTKVLVYFLDPRLKTGDMGKCMLMIAQTVVKTYLSKTLTGKTHLFSSPYVAQQLALFFAGCCHRIKRVQEVAIHCADLVISQVPSSLCQKSSLFALLELLSLMWTGCLERETDEYEWKSTFISARGNVEIQLSDDYNFRRSTLVNIHGWAKKWMLFVMDIAPLDIKGLIQTYLSEYDDDGAYGHVSLGRSFALEMGGVIPSTDQRLGAIESQPGLNINTASDFIAQYTTRQEYRFVGGIKDDDQEWMRSGSSVDLLMRTNARLDRSIQDARSLLADMEDRTLNHKHVSIAEIRDVLRRAGALLCSTDKDQGAIVHHLVGIPFAVFTKQSIKLGISLWMGVIKENPRMESRILVEIAENWEATVRKGRGLFNKRLHHYDPFDIKQEFAPSDRELIIRRQHTAYDLIAPHLRLVQFLSSHFNATRLGSPYVQKVYQRLINITLTALERTQAHPLAREAHFHIILLGLRILRYSGDLDRAVLWRFKDRLLSAALAWFAFPAR